MIDYAAPQEPVPAHEPPTRTRSPRAWARENLFDGRLNSVLTVVFALVLGYSLYRIGRFVLLDARWEIVERNITNLLVFRFPRDELWRLWLSLAIFAGAVGLGAGAAATGRAADVAEGRRETTSPWLALRRAGPLLALVAVLLWLAKSPTAVVLVGAVAAVALGGRFAGRRIPHRHARWAWAGVAGGILLSYLAITAFDGVGWERWGGLHLTIFLAVAGIVLSFPFGVLLALGRRSSFPAVRLVCTVYIELFRGVPLITVLFMGSLVIGFFLPPTVDRPSLTARALIALVLFTSAYVAEVVRGGLQSVPRGQIEAAMAVGLSPLKTTRLIVLPQALRAVIPAMVGQFISLFKDTSLVFIIGLTELLAVSESITKQPDFVAQGLLTETLLFASFVYWCGSYWMSRESQRLESRLGVGER
jgi:general L-amino acid transport system permease protein